MHENAFKWLGIIFIVFGLTGIITLIRYGFIDIADLLGQLTAIGLLLWYGEHLRTKKKWGFK